MGLLSSLLPGGSKTSSTSSQNWSDSSQNAGNDLFNNTGSFTSKSGLVNEGSGNATNLGDGIALGTGASFTINNDLSADIADRAISSAEASALLMKEVAMKQADSADRYVQSNANMAAQTMDTARALASQNIRADTGTSNMPLLAIVAVAAVLIYVNRK